MNSKNDNPFFQVFFLFFTNFSRLTAVEPLSLSAGSLFGSINLRTGRILASLLFTLTGSLAKIGVSARMGLPSETKIEPDRRLFEAGSRANGRITKATGEATRKSLSRFHRSRSRPQKRVCSQAKGKYDVIFRLQAFSSSLFASSRNVFPNKMLVSAARAVSVIACVAGGIVRVRRKILTVESEYGRRSREENGKENGNLAALPPLPRVGLARATIFRQLRRQFQ